MHMPILPWHQQVGLRGECSMEAFIQDFTFNEAAGELREANVFGAGRSFAD